MFQPLARRFLYHMDLQQRRQARQEHLTQSWITGEKSTYELRNLAAATKASQLKSFSQILGKRFKRINRLHRRPVAQKVGMPVRKDYNVARSQLFTPPVS